MQLDAVALRLISVVLERPFDEGIARTITHLGRRLVLIFE